MSRLLYSFFICTILTLFSQQVVFSLTAEEKVVSASLVPKEEQLSEEQTMLELARLYSDHRIFYGQALELYTALLAKDPENVTFLLEKGSLDAREHLYDEALLILRRLWKQNLPPSEKLAKYEELLGYAFASQKQLDLLLQEEEITSVSYANSILSWGGFYRAEAIYRHVLKLRPEDVDVLLQLIDALIASQRFYEAEGMVLKNLETARESKVYFLERLMQIKLYQKDYPQALSVIDVLLAEHPIKDSYFLEKGNLLYKMKEFSAALACYQHLRESQDFFAEAYLGMGKCSLKMGEEMGAGEALCLAEKESTTKVAALYYLAGKDVLTPEFMASILSRSTTAQELQLWGQCYLEEGFGAHALSCFSAAVAIDPNYFPAYVDLAERYAGQFAFETSLEIYETLIDALPDNAKLLLGRARVTSWNRDYNSSISFYDQLISLNPADPVVRLEQARVAYWSKKYDLSVQLYRDFLHFVSGEEWAMKKMYEETAVEMAINHLQWETRIFPSLSLYAHQMVLHPYSDRWKFEYGQALCSLGLCDLSTSVYEEIVDKDPLNTLVSMSLERERNKEEVSLGGSGSYWQEIGYGELSQVGRYGINTIITYPFSCRHKLRLIPRHWLEHTYFDDGYHNANGISLEWENRFDPFLSASAGVTFKDYDHNFSSTYTGFATLNFNFCNYLTLSLGGSQLDEVCNYFNLKQKTQKETFWGSIQTNISHELSCNALLERICFNDGNAQMHCVINPNYAFTNFPTVFKVGLTAEYRNTMHANIFIYDLNGELFDIVYPYWTPQSYFLGQVLFEVRHDYSPLEFCGAPIQFWDIKLAVGSDTQRNTYWEIKTEWQHEFYEHWNLNLIAYVHRSSQWNAKGFWLSCHYQF